MTKSYAKIVKEYTFGIPSVTFLQDSSGFALRAKTRCSVEGDYTPDTEQTYSLFHRNISDIRKARELADEILKYCDKVEEEIAQQHKASKCVCNGNLSECAKAVY